MTSWADTCGILTGAADRDRVASRGPVSQTPAAVIVVLLLSSRGAPLALIWLTLAVALYLTVIELRELRPHWKWWAWWLSVVFLTHFVGYLALRVYVAYRRWHRARA